MTNFLPTPAPTKYNDDGHPNPPTPTTSTDAFLSFNCPATPISGRMICRLYRAMSLRLNTCDDDGESSCSHKQT